MKQVDDESMHYSNSLSALPPLAAAEYPALQNYLRVIRQLVFKSTFTGDHDHDIYLTRMVGAERRSLVETKLAYTDRWFFNFFTVPLIRGNADDVLIEPNSIVLSEKMATKYFGDEDPIGEILLLNDSITLKVTGVFQNISGNSHLDFQGLMSTRRIEKFLNKVDLSTEAHTGWYVHLPGDTTGVQRLIRETFLKHCAAEFVRWNWTPENLTPQLQPLRNIAFERRIFDDFIARSRFVLTVFRVASVVILLMAWINYINLVASSYRRRYKELATRFVVGANRIQIFGQFMAESLAIHVVALLAAVTLIQLLSVPARLMLGFEVPSLHEVSWQTFLMGGLISGCGIVIVSLYPLIVVFRKTPRGIFSHKAISSNKFSIRWMATIQFSAAIILLIWIFIMYTQLTFLARKDLGFDRAGVTVVDLPYLQLADFENSLTDFMEGLSRMSGVLDYALSSSLSSEADGNGIGMQLADRSAFIGIGTNGGVDERYIPFYGLKIIAGRNFLRDSPINHSSVILSLTAMRRLGIQDPEKAIGRRVLIENKGWTHHMVPCEIIGIIQDYRRHPMFNEIRSGWPDDTGTALTYRSNLDAENLPRKMSLRLAPGRESETLTAIEDLYKHVFHGQQCNWYPLDQVLDSHYKNEQLNSNQIFVFTVISIGIACLGLLGTISNRVIEKTKEIGIRKVMGASVRHVVVILINTTLVQVVLASMIGIPMAYYLSLQYLEKFSDRIQLQWIHFALPVLILAAIMFVTIASSLWKAVKSNPVDALRYE